MKKSRKSIKRANQNISVDRVISNRILIFSVIIAICFLVIFLRLFYLQIVSYNEYTTKREDYTSIKQYTSAPRGQIYDCKGRVLAKTVVSHNIVFTSPNNMDSDDYELYAKRIVKVFNVSAKDFTDEDKKQAYITYKSFLSPTDSEYAANHLLTQKELKQYKNGAWGDNTESKRYQILMNRIGKKQIGEMTQAELKMCVIYQRMIANQSTGQENVVLEDVSDDDVAYLVEHKTEFPGFDVDFGGWKREYPYGESLSDILGSVTTSTQGLPSELSTYYLARDYQLNASVGKSGLEYQYNDLLAGTPEIAKITYDSKGLAQKDVIQQAKKGYDLYLSIDIDLQSSLDNIVKNTLSEYGGTKNRENFKSLFTTVLNPQDGSVLAMSGYQMDLDTKEMTYFATGNYMSLVNPGSCIKGATVYMGESEHVVSPGEVIVDKVMNIGGQEFGSYEDHGPVDDVSALQVSSNVYMFNIAIRLAGAVYEEKEPLAVADLQGTLNKMRSYYSMFGLGNITGLDEPGEVNGYMGYGSEPGMLLNYSIGQFDMYTPLQLAVYGATIASNGNVYQPRLMNHATEVNSSEVVVANEKKVKSTLPEKNAAYLQRVQEGFRACVASGYCSDVLKDIGVEVSAKTGTAEVGDWTTANLVGYAPSSAPTMAFACSAPTSSVNDQAVSPNICANNVMPEFIKKYFEIYPAS